MPRGFTILVADDSEDDFLLLQAAFRTADLPHTLIHVPDGNQAIMYLQGLSPFSDRHRFPFPNFLVLDLQMPHGNGFEVLTFLRGQPELQVPALMWSSSDLVQDIQTSMQLGAHHFCTKPASLQGMVELAKTIHDRWLSDSRSSKPSAALSPSNSSATFE